MHVLLCWFQNDFSNFRSETFESSNKVSVQRLIRIYKGAEIINMLYNESCSKLVSSLGLVFCCAIQIISCYVILKYSSGVGPEGVIIASGVWLMSYVTVTVAFHTCASTLTNSVLLRTHIEFAAGQKHRRDARQLRPLRMYVNNFFYVSRSSILTLMTNNVSILITLLLGL